ncbi:MAG: tilS [Rhodocyclaceae bacterium]|nr:tilS [Rhodocyclaceae bacterium]
MAGSKSSPSSRLLSQVRGFLAARLGPADRVCVGLSGGRDSVVLLHLLARLACGRQLSALHVHHGLSPHAGAWTAFCRELCASLDVPLQVEYVTVEADGGLGLEAAARAERYAAFSSCGADCLLLAHHQDDQAETLLFNLVRGTGVTGAAGMPAERRLGALRLLRPLLGVPRSDIVAYARESGLAWIDDESNDDTGFSRNFLRHEILPRLGERFPAASACLAGAAAHFAEADGLLAELAEADWQARAVGDELPMKSLRDLSPARLKNVLRHRLRCLGWRVPAARRLEEFVRQLLEAAPDTHPALHLPDGEMRVLRRRLCWIGQGIPL